LERVAKALGVTVQAVENFNDEAILNIISNTFNDESTQNYNCTFNPLDKVVELYERLLQSEREKIEILRGTK
jgi:predicted transcriptional regulator